MKLSTEQLLKIVAENKVVEKPRPARNANDVHRFIKDLVIKDGAHMVRAKIIYKTYKLWASSKPYSIKSFFKRFSQYFHPHNNGPGRYYLLNYRAVEMVNKVDNGRIKF